MNNDNEYGKNTCRVGDLLHAELFLVSCECSVNLFLFPVSSIIDNWIFF